MPNDHLVDDILKNIKVEVMKNIKSFFRSRRSLAFNRIKDIVRQALKNSQEYHDLSLRDREYHELGIPNIVDKMNRIIEYVVDDIQFDLELNVNNPLGNYLSFDSQIRILNLDYSGLLIREAAFYHTKKGDTLPWLEWILLAGDNPVIIDYHYVDSDDIGRKSPASRTGDGIMVKRGFWEVPFSIAGTREDNWLTNAISGIESSLFDIVQESFRED